MLLHVFCLAQWSRGEVCCRKTIPLRDRLQHAAMGLAAHCDDGCSVLHLNGDSSAMNSLTNCFFPVRTLRNVCYVTCSGEKDAFFSYGLLLFCGIIYNFAIMEGV